MTTAAKTASRLEERFRLCDVDGGSGAVRDYHLGRNDIPLLGG
ncbi:hypothetical protein AB0M72_08270 [Nocardiopsis dassonvillei]|nr:hypothetical protein [Nocardiopsis dassonvillei]